METVIDCTNKGLKISSYENDILKLNEMTKIYKNTNNLNSGFYTDMIEEIQSQIKHCKNCIENLKNKITTKL